MKKQSLAIAVSLALVSLTTIAADSQTSQGEPAKAAPSKLAQDVIEAQLPFKPTDIKAMREAREDVEKATNENNMPIDIRATVRTLDMTDGKPKSLTLAANFVTTLLFVGENGQPWKIEKILPGNKQVLATTETPVRDTSADITVLLPYMKTNLSVYLVGRVEPVTIFVNTIADPADSLDARINVMVDGFAPGSSRPVMRNVEAVDEQLLNAINFAPGAGWKDFEIANAETLPFQVRAWINNKTGEGIVRLNAASLRLPNWKTESMGANGTVRVYRFERLPLMMMVADRDGQTYTLRAKDSAATISSLDKPEIRVEPVKDLVERGNRALSVINSVTGKEDAVITKQQKPVMTTYEPTVSTAGTLTFAGSRSQDIKDEPDVLVGGEELDGEDMVVMKSSGKALTKPSAIGTRDSLPDLANNEQAFVWQIEGNSLRRNLEALSYKAGWSMFSWKAKYNQQSADWPAPKGLVFAGENAIDVLQQILSRYPLTADYYAMNNSVVVRNKTVYAQNLKDAPNSVNQVIQQNVMPESKQTRIQQN